MRIDRTYRWLIAFFLLTGSSSLRAQVPNNQLDLQATDWGLKGSVYHIARVEDERKKAGDAGSISGGGPVQPIRFKQDLAKDLLPYVQTCTAADTSKVALVLAFEKFQLKENRTGPRRNIQFEFQVRIYRDVDGQRVQLYQVGGTPSYVVHGPNPGIYDKLIGGSLQQALSGFDRWAKENRNQPPLCKHVRIELQDDGTFRDTVSADTIRWSSTYRLKWADFKGQPEQQVVFSANSACVYSFTSRPAYRDDTLILELLLHPAFIKPASWVKPDKLQDGLLAHEQLHFDICELYARRMRDRFTQSSPGLLTYDSVLKTIFESEWQAYQLRQADYDRETEHGLIPEQQANWEKSISEELNRLGSFASQ